MANNPFTVDIPQINPLQDLMGGYQFTKGIAKSRAMDDVGVAMRNNDTPGVIDALLRADQIAPAIAYAKMGREQEASAAFTKSLSDLFGASGGTVPQPQANPSSFGPAPGARQPVPAGAPVPPMSNADGVVAPARPAVASSPTVWGDDEAVKAGLYPPSSSPTSGVVPAAASPMPQQAPQGPQGSPQIATGGSINGIPLAKAMPALIAASTNPSLPKASQETARMMLGKAMDQYPQQIRELEIFQRRPDLYNLALGLKRAGATSINTAEGMDAAQAKARISIDENAVHDLSKKVTAGYSALPLINNMIQIGDKVPGGWKGAALPYMAKAAATLGVPVTENMSNAELLNAMTRQFIPSIRDPGSTSNYEQSLYMQAVPSLSQSPEGRMKIARMAKSQIERNADILKTYRQYIGSPQLDQKLQELESKPMFSPEDRKSLESVATPAAPAAGQLQRFNTPADIMKSGLKSGDHFLDSNGQERIVP